MMLLLKNLFYDKKKGKTDSKEIGLRTFFPQKTRVFHGLKYIYVC